MATIRKLSYCFDSNDMGRTAEAVVEQGLTPPGLPEEIDVDSQTKTVDDEWVTTLVAACVRGINKAYELDPPALARRLGRIPFTVASFGTVHAWSYRSPCFGNLHHSLGWGCAFQGTGHGRLVSRRWLATGPSRILRGPNDTTLVELHDFPLGLEDARAQAQGTHADLMAGFITFAYQFKTELKGLHKGNDRSLVFAIHGRVVSAQEMLDAAAARLLQPFGPEKPIDKVVYVFIDRAAADAQMPALWRYGHHVHLICDDGVERRIDDTHVPRIERPEWTRGDAA